GSGKLVGIVKDNSRRFVADALIQATEVRNQFVFTTTTDSTGKYQLRNLPAGEYSVEISATPPQNKPPESNSKSRYYLEQRYDTLDVIEVPIKPHQPTRLDGELTQYTAGICNDRIYFSPRQPEPATCIWTKAIKTNPDGTLVLTQDPAQVNQTWSKIWVLLLKDRSVRWVLR
ncbi:MAG TPA: carboxypeptidase-like regulatory domain-containing protein, partial [Acidobacteriota bacterium]|nr:carboxypeptidase-like regulatory domain-containing protein [Acidobacteriota bacterium]